MEYWTEMVNCSDDVLHGYPEEVFVSMAQRQTFLEDLQSFPVRCIVTKLGQGKRIPLYNGLSWYNIATFGSRSALRRASCMIALAGTSSGILMANPIKFRRVLSLPNTAKPLGSARDT